MVRVHSQFHVIPSIPRNTAKPLHCCAVDNDCLDDLVCYERQGFDPVPGCTGAGEVSAGRTFTSVAIDWSPSHQAFIGTIGGHGLLHGWILGRREPHFACSCSGCSSSCVAGRRTAPVANPGRRFATSFGNVPGYVLWVQRSNEKGCARSLTLFVSFFRWVKGDCDTGKSSR